MRPQKVLNRGYVAALLLGFRRTHGAGVRRGCGWDGPHVGALFRGCLEPQERLKEEVPTKAFLFVNLCVYLCKHAHIHSHTHSHMHTHAEPVTEAAGLLRLVPHHTAMEGSSQGPGERALAELEKGSGAPGDVIVHITWPPGGNGRPGLISQCVRRGAESSR